MKYLKKAKQKIAWERFYSNDFEWDKEQFYIDHVFSEEFLTLTHCKLVLFFFGQYYAKNIICKNPVKALYILF